MRDFETIRAINCLMIDLRTADDEDRIRSRAPTLFNASSIEEKQERLLARDILAVSSQRHSCDLEAVDIFWDGFPRLPPHHDDMTRRQFFEMLYILRHMPRQFPAMPDDMIPRNCGDERQHA